MFCFTSDDAEFLMKIFICRTRESHQLAEVTDIKNKKLREAFGIGEYDPREVAKKREEEKREEIERAKALNQRKYR